MNITERTVAALDALAVGGVTKTDALNKAVQVYAYLDSIDNNGGTLWIRETADGPLERLRIL